MGIPERRERERQERRDAIVGAASRVFLRKGLSQATMEDIAREAELSKGALYLYFKNKDELFLNIALAALADFDELIARVAQSDRAPAEKVRELLVEYLRYAGENQSRFQVAMGWLVPNYSVGDESPLFEEYQQAVQRVFDASLKVLKEAVSAGELVLVSSAERTWLQCWGALFGLLIIENSRDEIERRIALEKPGVEGLAQDFIEPFMGALAPAK